MQVLPITLYVALGVEVTFTSIATTGIPQVDEMVRAFDITVVVLFEIFGLVRGAFRIQRAIYGDACSEPRLGGAWCQIRYHGGIHGGGEEALWLVTDYLSLSACKYLTS